MIRVGVLTFNVIRSLRDDLLGATMDSIELGFPGAVWHLCDNGSNDGTGCNLDTPGWFFHRRPDAASTTPGAGRNALVRMMQPNEDDIVVLSDDDMQWRPGAGTALTWLWDAAPDNLVLVSGLLEPEYPWSKPTAAIEVGGMRALVRPSVPAAAWSFRARDWPIIGPLKETLEGDGEDFAACKRIAEMGGIMAAVDLATHIGEGYSQLGNDEARRIAGKPIDKGAWGLR